jgi:hypothetical protein
VPTKQFLVQKEAKFVAKPKIFVSYSRKDRDITQRIVSDLNKAGAEVWVDVEGITSGNFMQAIDKALEQCDWMVLILSPSAIVSEYVPEETYTALHRVKQGYMKGVIPVLVSACQPDSIPPQWDVLQRYDATQDYTTALAGVLRALKIGELRDLPSIAPAGTVTAQSDNVARVTSPQAWTDTRRTIFLRNHAFFLVHVLEPSKTPHQKFDVFVFVVRHEGLIHNEVVDLSKEIDYAEFFLGSAWGNRVFKMKPKDGRIGFSTSAYGPFLIICHVVFTDGDEVILDRYVDFEQEAPPSTL